MDNGDSNDAGLAGAYAYSLEGTQDTEESGHEDGGHDQMGGDEPLREQDRFLPIANVARIMKKAIPKNGKIAKEAKDCVQECVSEFVSFITSEASDRCHQEKRKTINGEDILFAMSTLGFDNFVEPLKVYLQKYRESTKGDKNLQMPHGEGGDMNSDEAFATISGNIITTADQQIIYATYPAQEMDATLTSAIGRFVPIRWQCLLRQEPRMLSPKMLCALELEDPAITCEISGIDEEMDCDAPVYIFVEVIQQLSASVDNQELLAMPSTAKYLVQVGEDAEQTVTGVHLYAFDPIIEYLLPQESYKHLVIVPSAVTKSKTTEEKDSRVEKIVENIWKESHNLTKAEQQSVVKRYYLHWHLMKNKKDERGVQFFSEITQNIRQQFSMENLLDRLDRRALNHSKQLVEIDVETLDCTDGGAVSFSGPPGSRYHSDRSSRPNPQPREAERWIKQATLDLESARNDVSTKVGAFASPEWACFKCHQAVEKALKAARIKVDADRCATHNLRELCFDLNGMDTTKVDELVRICVRSEAMRYPDCHKFPKIPHDVYKGQSERALLLAKDILQCIQRYMSSI